ncbi:Prefoldin subunit-domain-containing protein [Schizophyllum amplum]|uniref:Prefoldin subunit 3 n=1 Tax=Schizophyllum amplum TaxID=97359 RepID=A0A550C0M4_9AGAR|nr:Prefoldin subunit-domain-containing protein [Auriculariopsis ampla]
MSSKPIAVFTDEKNPRGIPKAPFIADVEEYLGGPDAEVEAPLKAFQDALAKYKYMDSNLGSRRAGLEEKIPDIKKTLSMVEFLHEHKDDLEDEDEDAPRKPIRTTFELNDTLFAEAELEDSDTVYLWLGANVMLSYPLPAAITLLTSKLSAAQHNLQNTIEDLEFLREQITVMEVNTARVYNWDVKRRREMREREAGKGKAVEGAKVAA